MLSGRVAGTLGDEHKGQEDVMVNRGGTRDDAWEGVVADKKRSSPDGQNMYHQLAVTLGDGTVKQVRVRRALWKSLEPGDRIVKRPGETAPVKIA
jgi:hypothetical protein